MKRILLVAAVLLCLSACSQYTCPTYAKQDVKPAPATDTEVVTSRI